MAKRSVLWVVWGADAEDARDRVLIVRALDADSAVRVARRVGVFMSRLAILAPGVPLPEGAEDFTHEPADATVETLGSFVSRGRLDDRERAIMMAQLRSTHVVLRYAGDDWSSSLRVHIVGLPYGFWLNLVVAVTIGVLAAGVVAALLTIALGLATAIFTVWR